ncbi:BRCT domain-containing protein [Enterococcus sp. LJL120]|uniref:BRCT domain-containing protein n=1 Tax=Enterococcus sp. HY326 TaxID=2971265 RepID=UPI00223FFADB|nr:BRCT domain-containing protein [Enterococcus sp. HY326]
MDLLNQYVVFTGTLTHFTRQQAHALVYALNGKPQTAVTTQTTILVIGTRPVNLLEEEKPSKKIQRADTLTSSGQHILYLTESQFLALIKDIFLSKQG